MTERTTIEVRISAEDALLLEVQRFYAAQMQLLDDGRAEQWAGTFTDDGVFAADAWPEPARGRRAIAEGARKTTEDLARRGVRRRHWLGMPAITRSDGDTLAVRSYALVIETPRAG